MVGGGQAGLAAGYYLKRERIRFTIIDGLGRVGDSWRRRWSSLRLFTPARIDGLPGLRFPADPAAHPTRDEVAAYLGAYATRFDLPVRSGFRVTGLTRAGDEFELSTSDGVLKASQVILATGRQGHRQEQPNFLRARAVVAGNSPPDEFHPDGSAHGGQDGGGRRAAFPDRA